MKLTLEEREALSDLTYEIRQTDCELTALDRDAVTSERLGHLLRRLSQLRKDAELAEDAIQQALYRSHRDTPWIQTSEAGR